ncbi:MAG: Rhomboid protease GluP [Nitrospira sp.]|nr:Rhomboid protease GluP [Nitrospira sp.]
MLDDRSYMREPEWRPSSKGTAVPVWLLIIIANFIFFVLQAVKGGFTDRLALQPDKLSLATSWQLLSFQFLHGDLLHLILNCAMIWMFGRVLEGVLGRRKFFSLYIAGGTVGGLLQCALAWILPAQFNPTIGVVGASAGIFALIAAFAFLQWEEKITTLLFFIIPITMRAKYLLLVLALIALLGMLDRTSSIAHGAHLGGMIGGLLFTAVFVQGGVLSGTPPWVNRLKRRQQHRRPRVTVTVGTARAFAVEPKIIEATEITQDEFIQREVDPILEKISKHGMQSLTESELEILHRARRQMER